MRGCLRQHGYKTRINHRNLVILAVQISFCNQVADGETIRNRNGSCLRKFGRQHFYPIARKKINSPLANWQYADGTFFEHWLNGLKHIAVVSTRQASVTCNNDQAALFDFTLLLIRRRKIIRRRFDAFQRLLEPHEIRATSFLTFFRLPELGGSDKFHRLGDLHGAFYAFNAQLDVFHR